MARLFFALWPNDEVRKELRKVSNLYKDENIRLTKNSNLHITLEFLGEVSEQDQAELIQQTNNIISKPFSFELTSIGYWPKPGILWIAPEIIPDELLNLVKQIQTMVKQQGLRIDERPYKPHVTIARKVKWHTVTKKSIHLPWIVSSFALIVSKPGNSGVYYEPIEEWPLV
ncbi:MAG: RNA 2',3'-cyclic phosphodiesterase [Proteobacteria bacterium]|nr:RNA 2',3'-cyclic phosphodiesterase [Pseudomonadota bacterium]NOG60307.1 RNA 2',3'-cyclic phosphodiesterase [Pseudomonadota bacterium]